MKHPLQQAEFLTTAARDDQLPPPGSPEVAFAGRSNAGKSSAINALANQTRLAFTSKTPGRTQQINLFRLRAGALLADLPGYGYAAVPQELKRHWQEFVAHYLATRQTLVGLARRHRELRSFVFKNNKTTFSVSLRMPVSLTDLKRPMVSWTDGPSRHPPPVFQFS